MYRLEFRSANGETTSFDEQRVLRIGRSRDNDIVLDNPSVSRRHGELRPTVAGWDLEDIGSAGGTWVKQSTRLARLARRDDDSALRQRKRWCRGHHHGRPTSRVSRGTAR